MLDKKDLVLIREVVCEAIDEVVTPQFEAADVRFERIEGRLDRIESTMVTKDYLEDRLNKFKIEILEAGKWVSRQMSRLTDILYKNKLLTAEQVIQIRAE